MSRGRTPDRYLRIAAVTLEQENGATFLSLVLNGWNTVEIVILTALLAQPVSVDCASIYTPAAAASGVFLIAGVCTVMLIKDDTRRGDAEKAWAVSKGKGGCADIPKAGPIASQGLAAVCRTRSPSY